MQSITQLLALAATLSTASAGALQGFNYGAMTTDDAAMMQADFETSFKTAKNLVGTENAFTSARLYTMIQAYSTSDVIQAIPAAIATNTTLLLGLWASGTGFANEITALEAAISTYGSQLTDLVVGISVGSEDLYRNSETSIANGGDIGQSPDTLVEYITQVRNTIKGTALSGASIGHVDTWDAWTNSTNDAVITAIDWIGVDEYPYWQLTDGNSVENGPSLFQKALSVTQAVAGGKDIWVTETGWAVSGPTEGEATAGLAESKTYWDTVGCDMLFGKINTFWYTLTETGASPDFGVSDSQSNTTPLYDLSCTNSTKVSSSSSSAAASSTATGSASASSGSSSGSSGSSSGTNATLTTAAAGSTKTASSASGSTSSSSSITNSSGAVANAASIGGLFAAFALALAL